MTLPTFATAHRNGTGENMRGRSVWDWNTGEPSIFMTKADMARQAKSTAARRKRGRPAKPSEVVQIVYSRAARANR